MARQSREQEYEQTGMTMDERDAIIWDLSKRGASVARIAKRMRISTESVHSSLRRTARRRAGQLAR